VWTRKTNKKHQPVGKPVFVGFQFVYNTAVNPATVGLAANYEVASTTTRVVKRRIVTTHRPVAVTAAYSPLHNSVTLFVEGKPNFTQGGQIEVVYLPPTGVSSVAGVPLDADDTEFTILPKARGITPG
jgi:hypothetical protein